MRKSSLTKCIVVPCAMAIALSISAALAKAEHRPIVITKPVDTSSPRVPQPSKPSNRLQGPVPIPYPNCEPSCPPPQPKKQ